MNLKFLIPLLNSSFMSLFEMELCSCYATGLHSFFEARIFEPCMNVEKERINPQIFCFVRMLGESLDPDSGSIWLLNCSC